MKKASEAKTDEDDCEFTDCLFRDYQLAPPLVLKEIRKGDIGIRGQREIGSALDIVDLSGSPVRESRTCGEVTAATLPPLPEVMRLQLERPGAPAILSMPKVVRAASSPAKSQGVGVHNEVEGVSRDLTNLPGPDAVSTAVASSKPVSVGTPTQPGTNVAITNRGKQVVRKEAPRGKRKTLPIPQAAQQA